ncbi:MAG: hypothetical protein HC828_09925 [Blastochloris sp.]|nr:hypothetical protein [Blastochloris sp.]
MIQVSVGSTFALIDDDDEPLVLRHVWCIDSDGAAVTARGRRMHRMIMQPVRGQDVIHRDGNPLNNQRANLVIVPRSVNAHRARRRSDNTSTYKGVSFDSQRERQKKAPWRAQVKQHGQRHVSKWCWTPEEAALWYNDKARELFGEFAYQNEIAVHERGG